VTYETADAFQRVLIDSIASWVAHVRGAYKNTYTPAGKNVVNINDFSRDNVGLKLKVFVRGQPKTYRLTYMPPRTRYLAIKGLTETNLAVYGKLKSIFPGFNFDATLTEQGLEIMRMDTSAVEIAPVPRDASNQQLRIAATRAEATAREVACMATVDASTSTGGGRSDAGTGTDISGDDIERLRELERGINNGKADLIA
jgi:hypothetical protein